MHSLKKKTQSEGNVTQMYEERAYRNLSFAAQCQKLVKARGNIICRNKDRITRRGYTLPP